jgi:adenylate cyclase class 1
MPESPLPALLVRNHEGMIQVFFLPERHGIRLFILDECGAVYQQWSPDVDEYHLLVQQRRFLDTVAAQRLLATTDAATEPGLSFARIEAVARNDWQVTPIAVPRTRITDHVELILSVNPGGRLQEGFRLQLASREYDSLLLGDRLYAEVAAHLKRLRRGNGTYPVYLTGVVGAETEAGSPCRLMDLLHLRRQVEQRLAEAMRG